MMNPDCFKPLKDFELYEVSSNGDVRKRTTKRMLTAQKTKSGDRFHLHDSGHVITISRNKLQYCFLNDASPYEIRDNIVSNGVLLSVASHCDRLALFNSERLSCIAEDKEREDVIFNYERAICLLSDMLSLLKGELSKQGAVQLEGNIKKCMRKALIRYYRDKREYRKEEIEDIARELFYGSFINHCPLNIDCYVYEIVKRKLKNKKYD